MRLALTVLAITVTHSAFRRTGIVQEAAVHGEGFTEIDLGLDHAGLFHGAPLFARSIIRCTQAAGGAEQCRERIRYGGAGRGHHLEGGLNIRCRDVVEGALSSGEGVITPFSFELELLTLCCHGIGIHSEKPLGCFRGGRNP
jgi:hypothetical protein